MGRLKLVGEQEVGGAAVDILEGESTIVAGASKLSFGAPDFAVSDAGGGRADVAIDYASSGICRKAQNETITGDWQFDGQVGIQSAPDPLISLRVEPSSKAWTSGPVHLIKVGAQSAIMNANASVYAIGGMATISAGGGYTLPDLAGLFFTAASSGVGNITNMYGVYVRHALVGFSGSLSTLRGLHVHPPMYIGSTSPTRSWGLNVTNQGRAGITDTFGLMIHDQSGSVNNYLIWAGANESGTPNLRLDAGTPATDKSNLILNFGGTLLRLIKDANGFVKAEAL